MVLINSSVLSCTVSLFAATVVLGGARTLDAEGRGAVVALCLWAVTSAWLLTHSAFTLRDPAERRQAFHVLVGTILGTAPFVLLGIVLPSLFAAGFGRC